MDAVTSCFRGKKAMLVIQHIWSRWDKLSRGANAPIPRPRLDAAYPLPAQRGAIDPQREALVHEVAADMWRDGGPRASLAPVTHAAWHRGDPALRWHTRAKDVEIMLANPCPWRLQTKWPAHLPMPLFTLHPGESARVEWNGRMRMSLFGSNRSSYYEQHIYWLAVTHAPDDRIFLDATPRKTIDLTTHIY
jgi:hypothetical protein